MGAQEHYDCVGCLWVHKNIMTVLVACGCTITLWLCRLLVGAQEHYDCVGCLWVHKNIMAVLVACGCTRTL